MSELRDRARQKIATVAAAMVDGSLSYVEGARRISAVRFEADMENDPDVLPFVGIDSETDALPFGSVREHWKPAALMALQPQIESAQIWAEEFGRQHCLNLIGRLRP